MTFLPCWQCPRFLLFGLPPRLTKSGLHVRNKDRSDTHPQREFCGAGIKSQPSCRRSSWMVPVEFSAPKPLICEEDLSMMKRIHEFPRRTEIPGDMEPFG